MFHRIGAAAYKADLKNTIEICNLLGNPQDKFKSIHIAGTNGKGSVSHFLASILQENGYKVGLYTSPHLKDFRERIKINGKEIPIEKVNAFVERHKTSFDSIKPSFFEWTVGLAFSYFAEEKVDVAIIETGLGGRLDSTNIITPELSIITNISWDHSNLLGDTLAKIAGEKAGIIKTGVPVVIGETQEEVKEVFINKCKEVKAPLYFADRHFHVLHAELVYNNSPELMVQLQFKNGIPLNHVFEHDSVLRSSLIGYYQVKNLVTVLMSVDILNTNGFTLQAAKVEKGITNVIENTGIMGRWQKINEKPLVVSDIGHNEGGLKETLTQIKFTPHNKLHMVLGFVNDKDIDTMLAMLPNDADYYFCKAQIPRALDETLLAKKALEKGIKGNMFPTVEAAYKSAKEHAGAEDLIYIGGSTFVVAEVL
jgi:dihydrofolate synthase/folylpolyglutamate synthase